MCIRDSNLAADDAVVITTAAVPGSGEKIFIGQEDGGGSCPNSQRVIGVIDSGGTPSSSDIAFCVDSAAPSGAGGVLLPPPPLVVRF